MPFDFIKNWIFKNELTKTVATSSSAGEMVGIYINHTTKEELKKVEDLLVVKGTKRENIKFLAFVNQTETTAPNCKSYNLKSIKWAGYPQSVEVEEFLNIKYKKFYYLASSYEPHQMFILKKIQASFKAGIHHKGIEQNLDFIVDAPFQNIHESLKIIYHTIEKITKP